MKIAIIGGGNIGGSIAKGLAAGNTIKSENIAVADLSEQTLEKIRSYDDRIRTTTSNIEAIEGMDVVFVAVKPWQLEEVVNEIKPHLDYESQVFVSVVAGVPFDELKRILDKGDGRYPSLYRVMPNTAMSEMQSMTFVASAGPYFERQDMFHQAGAELGKIMAVQELMMPAATSLASCGIAFALQYLKAAIEGGEEVGFTAGESRAIVMQTMRGALALLEANGSMPQEEIDKVTTPGGLTLKGLEAMAEAGFDAAVKAGIKKSR